MVSFLPQKKTPQRCPFLWRREIFCCHATKCRRSHTLSLFLPFFASRSSREPLRMQPFRLTFLLPQKKTPKKVSFFVAQRKGFEPLYTFLHNTISNRARSTAPPSLQTAFILYIIILKNATVFALFLLKISSPRKELRGEDFALH